MNDSTMITSTTVPPANDRILRSKCRMTTINTSIDGAENDLSSDNKFTDVIVFQYQVIVFLI